MSTKAKSTKLVPSPFISDAEACELIRRILPVNGDADDDDAAKALITIIDRLSAETNLTARENNREAFFRAIFCNSAAFDAAQTEFINGAGLLDAA